MIVAVAVAVTHVHGEIVVTVAEVVGLLWYSVVVMMLLECDAAPLVGRCKGIRDGKEK